MVAKKNIRGILEKIKAERLKLRAERLKLKAERLQWQPKPKSTTFSNYTIYTNLTVMLFNNL